MEKYLCKCFKEESSLYRYKLFRLLTDPKYYIGSKFSKFLRKNHVI